jgi:hypothetical protein
MHPLESLGKLFVLVAITVSVILGYASKPILFSVAIGSLLFTISYILVRLPHLLGIYQEDCIKILLLFFYQFLFYSIIAAIMYGIGFGVSSLLS